MRLKYQARLTFIATASAGLVIGLIFIALVALVSKSEKSALDRDLRLGLDEALGEMREEPKNPDLGEVTGGHPGLSVALFSADGNLFVAKGPVTLDLEPSLAHYVHLRKTVGTRQLVVAISSQASDERVRELSLLTLCLWLPLTAAFGLVIWLTGKSTFAPLAAMADQASTLGDGRRSLRLPMTYGGEYDQFTAKLNGLLDKIEAGVHRQEQFAYDAAHELRTPLTILSGHLQERLRKGVSDPADEKVFLELLAEMDRLTTLVNMLLQSAMIKSDLDEARVEVSACLEASAARWLDRYTVEGVGIEVEGIQAFAPISSSELETVLDNLLSNALRVSTRGQSVRIGNQGSAILVEDEGPGIPSEASETIFSPFVRLDTGRNRGQGGIGLGLSICRRLIEDRKGTIKVLPGNSGGTVFRIELPEAN